MVKLHFKRGKHAEMMASYKQMLTYIKSAVTRNYSEKVINKILDLVSGTSDKKIVMLKPIDEIGMSMWNSLSAAQVQEIIGRVYRV